MLAVLILSRVGFGPVSLIVRFCRAICFCRDRGEAVASFEADYWCGKRDFAF